jgi:hypothetical protein
VQWTKFHGTLFWSAGINRRGEIASATLLFGSTQLRIWLLLALVTRECQKIFSCKTIECAPKANRGQHRELEKDWSFQKNACPQLSRTQANRDDFPATSALVHFARGLDFVQEAVRMTD